MVNIHTPGLPGYSGGENDVQIEARATANALQACGFDVPSDITVRALISGIGKAFIPGELPPAEQLSDVSLATRRYFGTTVQPSLRRASRLGDQNTEALAYQVGRLIGTGNAVPHPGVTFSDNQLFADGYVIPYAVESGTVLEYGLGLNGLFAHVANLKANRYHVTGIHKSSAEVTVLRGLAAAQGVKESSITLLDKGVSHQVTAILKSAALDADLIIASRVHQAGSDLRPGLVNASKLLRHGGLLVARGPRRFAAGIGYDQIAKILDFATDMHVSLNQEFAIKTSPGQSELNRLIIAEKQ